MSGFLLKELGAIRIEVIAQQDDIIEGGDKQTEVKSRTQIRNWASE